MKLALQLSNSVVRVARTPEGLRDWSPLIVWPLSYHIQDRVGFDRLFDLDAVYQATIRWSPTGRYRFGDYQEDGMLPVRYGRRGIGSVCVARATQLLKRPFRDIRGKRFSVALERIA